MRLTDILWLALSHTSIEDKDVKSSVTPTVLSGSVCHLRAVYRFRMSRGSVTTILTWEDRVRSSSEGRE